mgnify:FL=1
MKLTTKGRYAIISMVDLAMNAIDHPVPLRDISLRQNISLSYLEQLFSKLRLSGLVKSIRGPGGGYMLRKNPMYLNLLDIITAVDEKIDQTQCGGAMNCTNEKPCLTHFIWTDLNNKINDYMREITLDDITLRKDVQNIIFLRENKNVSSNQRSEK